MTILNVANGEMSGCGGQGIDTYRIAASEVMADPDEVALGFCLLAKDRAALRLSGPLRPDCAGHLRRFAREKRVK
jgi:hypothetical protein